VLLVDGDLGFTFWLSQLLASVGHTVIPASSPENARSLLNAVDASIDLMIVDFALAGAKELVDFLRASSSPINVMALVESDEHRDRLPASLSPDGYCLRPSEMDALTNRRWIDLIQSAVPTHAVVF
jgi:DNA-binding response OmpR family regulator